MMSSNGNIFRVTVPLCIIPPVTGGFKKSRKKTNRPDTYAQNKRCRNWANLLQMPRDIIRWKYVMEMPYWHDLQPIIEMHDDIEQTKTLSSTIYSENAIFQHG